MAWTVSKLYPAFVTDAFNNTTAMDLNADTFKVALFDNTLTPGASAVSANTAYGVSTWASGGVSDAVSWPAAGRSLASVASGFTAGTYTFDAADTTSADASTDLTNVYGCLVYDDTITTPVADQGLCFIYLGGANTVVAGTFTIAWSTTGIFTITV